MHPNAFLRTFWRAEVLDTVFVAMSFDPRFDARYSEIIQPSVEGEPFKGRSLKAHRVDISKTGDSILTEIVTGIAHARLVLADVSVIDEGRYTQIPIRNANVMYEVGVALACRTPAEVLLVRDDNKPLLFDLSTTPTMSVDFSDPPSAIAKLRAAISDRLSESSLPLDARVRSAVHGITPNELTVLEALAKLPGERAQDLTNPAIGMPPIPIADGLSRLLGKGLAQAVAINSKTGCPFYRLTPVGRAVATAVSSSLRRAEPDAPAEPHPTRSSERPPA